MDGEPVHAVLHRREGVPEAPADESDRHEEVPETDWCPGCGEDLQNQPDGECGGDYGERDEAGDDRQHGAGEEHHIPDGCEVVSEDHREGAAKGPEEVLQTSRHRAGHRSPEIRSPDDEKLPEGYSGRCHQYADGCRCIQHEALDEQKCLFFFCLLAEDVVRTPRECDIWKRKPMLDSRDSRLGGLLQA